MINTSRDSAMPGILEARPHTDHYRLTCPIDGLAVQLTKTADQPPRIVPRLVPPQQATRFATRHAAVAAWAEHIGAAVLEIQRVDA